jgi:hypothetical protein
VDSAPTLTSGADTVVAPPPQPVSWRLLAAVVSLALLGGLLGGLGISRLDQGDQIVVGNTAGTLSAVMRLGGRLIVVGGGDSRTDLSDLVGRSTLPWSRRIDLLIVPGWDSQQVVGALGLIESGDVRELAILGTPSGHPDWSLLLQSAAQRDIVVSQIAGERAISLDDGISLDLLAPSQDVSDLPAALVRLRYHGNEVTLADIASTADRKSLAGWDALPTQTNLLVATRPLAPSLISSPVVLRPQARQSSEIDALAPSYVADLAPGTHFSIALHGSQFRLPANHLHAEFASPPG